MPVDDDDHRDQTDSGAGTGASDGKPDHGPAAPPLRKRALIEAVAAASGQKLPAVRAVTDALLQELGAALARGETVALPPLGRLTVARSKEAKPGQGAVLILRLKRPGPGAAAVVPAAAEEQD